jgi:hypothetical protein
LLFLCLLAAFGAGAEQDVTIAPRPAAADEQERLRSEVLRLGGLLYSADPAQACGAIQALGATRSPLALPYLWQAYAAGDGARRRTALAALGQLKAPGQDERLFHVSLSEPYLGLRRAAAQALAQCAGRDAAVRKYMSALEDPKALVPLGRLRAVQLLAHLGGPGVAAALRGLLNDADADVVCAACEGLAVLAELDAVPDLLPLLPRKDVETGPAAVEALERLTGQKNRYDLVKWDKWLADWKAGRLETKPAAVAGSTDEGYRPDYGDPYAVPVTESAVDFVVVFDTTGSLAKLWPQVAGPIDAVLDEMARRTPCLRLGAVRYRADKPDRSLRYLIQPKPLTRDLQSVRDFVQDASFGGGSGGLHLGLLHAISAFNWRAYARQAMLVVGDITPSGDGLARCLLVLKDGWEQDRIHFNCLYIRSLHGEEHRPTYRQLAAAGAGRFYEYDRAWSRLVDLSVEKPEPKEPERPMLTLEKWLAPTLRR